MVGIGSIFAVNWYWRSYQREISGNRKFVLGALVILTPLFALIFGIRLPLWGGLPLPDVAVGTAGKTLMLFAALPALLGAWLFGPLHASILGMLAGISLAYFDTHSPFTILEFSWLAILFSVAVSQNYRTWLYRALRRPFLASLLLSSLYPLLFVLDAFFWVSGTVAERLDFAISNSYTATIAVGGSLIIAGLLVELVVIFFSDYKASSQELLPAPGETSLKIRFLNYIVWSALSVVVLLIVVNWFVAGRSAKESIQSQMASVAQTTTEAVPHFLNTGQSLVKQFAGNLANSIDSPDDLKSMLEQDFRVVPFFSQLYVLDAGMMQIASYPENAYLEEITSPEEQAGLDFALAGIPVQVYAVQSLDEKTPAEISFLGTIFNAEGTPQGILIGRINLIENPFTQTIVNTLQRMDELNGMGFLIDGEGQLLYASDVDNILGGLPSYDPEHPESFYESSMADGTRQLVYTKSTLGGQWTVMLTVPASQAQELALDLATPMSGVIILLGIVVTGGLYIGLNSVAKALHSLIEETNLITKGQLDHSLEIDKRVDEVGRLRHSFEKMRQSLKARIREMNRLLKISRGVASSLEIGAAVRPILESGLDTGARSVRIVLASDVILDESHDSSKITYFGIGPETEKFSDLDHKILAFAKDNPYARLQNPSRASQLGLDEYAFLPGAILVVALRDERQYYGVLWLAFDTSHSITDEEMRFVATLAGQATLATTNAQLFMRAKVGRQRLAAILASTVDPMLVTDHLGCLLLANPAAWDVLGLDKSTTIGQPIKKLISQPALVDLLLTPNEEQGSVEIPLGDGRVFQATASQVVGEDRQLGGVCVMRDITYLKEMDELKSNFVSTVSHDLRSPLTLMRGYATMLELVGNLNKQQMGYVRKIVTGVESMSRLVENLLDLGRIEAEVGLKLEMLSVHDIVATVTEALELHAQQKNIALHVSSSAQTTPLIEADQALLQQALQNLVENAIKYTLEGGEIWVRYGVKDTRMVFEVQDTGVGISPINQQRLFEKFYRVERRDVTEQRGTGLGLAIVKSIAEQHGGEVWVKSELDAGSIFCFAIPIRHAKKG